MGVAEAMIQPLEAVTARAPVWLMSEVGVDGCELTQPGKGQQHLILGVCVDQRSHPNDGRQTGDVRGGGAIGNVHGDGEED